MWSSPPGLCPPFSEPTRSIRPVGVGHSGVVAMLYCTYSAHTWVPRAQFANYYSLSLSHFLAIHSGRYFHHPFEESKGFHPPFTLSVSAGSFSSELSPLRETGELTSTEAKLAMNCNNNGWISKIPKLRDPRCKMFCTSL